MAELRWILLGAGLALIAGIYLWGLRTRSRSAASESGRVIPEAPTAPSAPAETAESVRVEPRVRLEEAAPRVHEVVPRIEIDDGSPAAAGRREPTLGQRLTSPQPRPASPEPVQDRPPAEPDDDAQSQTQVEARAQRIVALRVVAPLPSRFEGGMLHEAVLAEQFQFGRYQIFHRMDAQGRPTMSLASLREPGTFDPATMAGAAYAGIAIFAVVPGPLTGQQSLEELLAVSRSLAARLGGHVQDDRGVPLTMQRVARLREEMQAFDRGRAGSPGH